MNRMVLSLVVVVAALGAAPAGAQEAGHVKVAKGAVQIERAGQKVPATLGAVVQAGDVLVTGADGSVGITFLDNSLFSAGPNSVLVINKYRFDTTTHAGELDASLNKGSLAVVSGKMVKQSPESMRIRTPSSIMGVRGTEFVVKVD